MAREAQGVVQVQFVGTLLNILSAEQGDQVQAPWGLAPSAMQLTTGVEEDQINRTISKRSIQLASGEVLLLDMYDLAAFNQGVGDGLDLVGQSYQLDQINGLFVLLKAGSPGTLKIGGEGSGAAWDSLFDGNENARIVLRSSTAQPGIFLLQIPAADGLEVVDSTNHILKFEAVGGSVDFGFFANGRDLP